MFYQNIGQSTTIELNNTDLLELVNRLLVLQTNTFVFQNVKHVSVIWVTILKKKNNLRNGRCEPRSLV